MVRAEGCKRESQSFGFTGMELKEEGMQKKREHRQP